MGERGLKRELGLLQTTMMGIGGAVSAGVFVTLGYAATLAGTALIIATLFCGVVNLFSMLSYAELGAAIPSAGGEYTYVKTSFGGFISFSTGWFEWVSNMFFGAFSAVGFAYLVSYAVQTVGLPMPASISAIAVLTVTVFALINVKGIKETGTAQTVLVIILLGVLGLFVAYGLLFGRGGSPTAPAPEGLVGILRASAFIFVVYLGGEAIAVAQAEVKNPSKTIPRAILLTSLALISIYTIVALVVLNVVRPEDLAGKESPLAYVAQQLMGPLGVGLVTLAGSIAALSSVNTAIMAQSRVAYALARDGYFPKIFSYLHIRYSTPHIAILVGAILIGATAALEKIAFVTYATDFGFIIGFVFVNLSLIKLRRSHPGLNRPFKVPLYPLTPILGIATCILLMLFLEPNTLFIGLELFIFGFIAYYVRMVEHQRLRLALGGMNLGISAFTGLLALLLAVNALPGSFSPATTSLLFGVAISISIIYLCAGLINIIRGFEG